MSKAPAHVPKPPLPHKRASRSSRHSHTKPKQHHYKQSYRQFQRQIRRYKKAHPPAKGAGEINDCAFAASAYAIEAKTGQLISDTEILEAYSAVTGYDPLTGVCDVGAPIEDALAYWRELGLIQDFGRNTWNFEPYALVGLEVSWAAEVAGHTAVALSPTRIVTWGQAAKVPPGFLNEFADEAWTVIP